MGKLGKDSNLIKIRIAASHFKNSNAIDKSLSEGKTNFSKIIIIKMNVAYKAVPQSRCRDETSAGRTIR